jgi:hypothetical protein
MSTPEARSAKRGAEENASEEARARLAAAQGELVRALVGQGEAPAGFDEARLALAARSLVGKRLREVARAWPALCRCLGERWAERFRDWAAHTPPPGEGGPLADGAAFLRAVPPGELDDKARLEALMVSLHWWRTRRGLRRRRGFVLKSAWLPGQRRLVVGVRLPWLGARLTSIRVPGRSGNR